MPQKPCSSKPLPSYSNTAWGAGRLLVNTDVLIPVFKMNIKNTEMRCFFPTLVIKIGRSVSTTSNTRWETSPDGLDQ